MAYLDVAGRNASPANPNMPNDSEWNSGLFLIYQNVAFGRSLPPVAANEIMQLITRLTR